MKSSTLFVILYGAFIIVTATAEDAAPSWPQWRGPLGNGVVPEGKPVTEWSEDKNVKWKVDVAGSGTSTPIIVGDQSFLLTASGTGKKVEVKAEEDAQQQRSSQRERRERGDDLCC